MRRLIIVLVIIAALLLISPLLTGKMAEKELKAATELLSQQMGAVQLVETDHDRGWFDTETDHEFLLDPSLMGMSGDTETQTGVTAHTEIMHGPVIVGAGDSNLPPVTVALAISKTTFSYAPKDGGEGFDVPGALYNKIGLSGGGTLWGIFDPIEDTITNKSGDDADIKWGGGRFETQYNAGQTELDTTFSTEPLSITATDGRFDFGTMSGTSVASKESFGFWTGSGGAKIANVAFDSPDGKSMTMTDFTFDADTELVGEDRVSGNFSMAVANINAPDFNNFSVRFPFQMNNMDAESIGRLQEIADSQTGNPEDAQIMMMQMQEVAMQLVTRGFGLAIPGFSMEGEHGQANLDLTIDVPETDEVGQAAVMGAILGATGNAEFRIDRSLLEFFAKDNPQIQQQVAGMVQSGFLTEDGDALVMIAGYEGGLLTVNGLPIPLPIPGG